MVMIPMKRFSSMNDVKTTYEAKYLQGPGQGREGGTHFQELATLSYGPQLGRSQELTPVVRAQGCASAPSTLPDPYHTPCLLALERATPRYYITVLRGDSGMAEGAGGAGRTARRPRRRHGSRTSAPVG